MRTMLGMGLSLTALQKLDFYILGLDTNMLHNLKQPHMKGLGESIQTLGRALQSMDLNTIRSAIINTIDK